MRLLARLLLAGVLVPAGTHEAGAQARALSWPRVSVEARLDSSGRLHVREVQTMRFTGDWNGGERSFNLRNGQMFWLHRLSRVDSATGTLVEMKQGDLDVVDGFDFTTGSAVRWRARLPHDPPFDRTDRTYQFEYVFSQILIPSEEDSTQFLLDHDFAFTDREGDIGRFTLYLTLDSAWKAPPGFSSRFTRENLTPGEGFVVTAPLTWTRQGRPGGVDYGAQRPVRYALALLVLLPILPLAVLMVRREHALGRFAPLVPADEIDERWLETHVFRMEPEVVGHAWDDTTGEAEVAATIARLVQEGKLRSSVEKRGRSIFSRDVLGLELLVNRGSLSGHERALIDGLFVSGDTTDTDMVRIHYKSSGFDPAALIRKPLAILADSTPGAGTTLPKPSRWPSLVLLVTAVITFASSVVRRPQDAPLAFASLGIMFVTYVFCITTSALWQRRVRGLGAGALLFAVPLAIVTAALVMQIVTNPFRAGATTLFALAMLWLAFTNSVLNQAMARQSAERIALRKRLASAREFFRRELRRDQPALHDQWFAYLIAFGLGRHIDKWFRAFGDDVSRTGAFVATSSGSSSSSSPGPSWTGFGGGGGFSGGGSSASFAAAVGGMASSVPSPSSSGSSGGGGGGGGSSGGGGGGGW
jgi:uncharacterized membrane protein YgcG